MRLTHKLDKAPAITWLDGNAPDDFAIDAKSNMGKLAVGEAFVGSVGAEFFERVKVPMNQTFDSSATPKRGEELVQPQTLAQVDLSALKTALAPKDEPEQEPALNKQTKPQVESVTLAFHKNELARHKAKAYQDGKSVGDANGHNRGYATALQDAQKAIGQMPCVQVTADVNHHATPKPLTEKPTKPTHIDDDLTGPEKRVMDALAFWDALGFESVSREQVAFVASYSVKSGGFRNTLSALRRRDMVDYSGGNIVANSLPKLENFLSFNDLAARLSGPQLRVLEPLKDGAVWTRDGLAALANYSVSSGGFRNTLSSLRTQKILDYGTGSTVQLLPWVITLIRSTG